MGFAVRRRWNSHDIAASRQRAAREGSGTPSTRRLLSIQSALAALLDAPIVEVVVAARVTFSPPVFWMVRALGNVDGKMLLAPNCDIPAKAIKPGLLS